MNTHPVGMNDRLPTRADAITVLNSFLRGELAAVETYRQAIERLDDFTALAHLRDCLSSHRLRAERLAEQVRRLGGVPSRSSGSWGVFARLFEGGAKLFGEAAAIAALEQGEDHGRIDYKRDMDCLDAESRRFVEAEILPEQLRTHDVVTRLKHKRLGS